VAPTPQAAERSAGTVPASVQSSVLLRLARLDASARQFARAATVTGTDAPLRHVAAPAELTTEQGPLAADALLAVHILRTGDPVRFAHPLIADAIASARCPSSPSRR
jgi:hypothetical protein